jgi:pimeloyl-ACP methyl ester carboxylesterase
MIRNGWTDTRDAKLHYLIANCEAHLTPLVYLPGSLGSAEDFRDEMMRLAPRTTVALSPRGLGKSSSPPEGYSFEQRIADMEWVLRDLDLEPFCLMAYSLGVPIAIGYAAQNLAQITGLILLDYPARYPRRSQSWLERALPFARERGIEEHVVQRLQQESADVELWAELQLARRPTLLVKAGQSTVVSDDDLEQYRQVPHVQVEVFEDATHEIHKPDYESFIGTLERFLRDLDNSSTARDDGEN